ncbi:WYL domain-containing protein [Cryomorpha ignava]|uniref:WYL domain-containing protein n=1 Tax=Cryomorpha ignava TaxID=101383 RepID=A0A7K3WRK5_9FLAO|nr:WYL domain-containing protein [Cryomorpha ignava]NEN24307.1 WYL domain-containing protein [Cryomorpha ignava]
MALREKIARMNLIITKLRRKPCTWAEMKDYLGRESELQEYNFIISERTFQRDVNDIREIYNIDIQYNRTQSAYQIDFSDQVNERILEAYDTFNALNLTDRLSQHIHFEKRRPQGTENLHGFLHAIQNQLQIKFVYQKYWEGELTNRRAEPYALKEFRNRWYILAKDLKDNITKTFALDRLTDLEITNTKFQFPEGFDVNEYFKNYFGITAWQKGKPQEIILSFNEFQGKYIKSLPLHHSQQVLIDNAEEFRIKLSLNPTHDLIMELLSYGENLKVIQPVSLVEEIKKRLKATLARYE